MAEKQRPDWCPPWEPGKYLRVASHHQVWNEATEAAVKAVIEQIERWNKPRSDIVKALLAYLREEAGLE